MNLRRGALIGTLLVAVLQPSRSSALAQQDTTTAVQDTAAATPDDTTVTAGPQIVAMYESEVPRGPLPPGTRYTFTRDSIWWSSAETLADLLTVIPGVYIARAGFLGQPDYVMYAGRGTGGIEVFWDGVPLQPVGDSVYTDFGLIKLSFIRRVDVEVLPTSLRVFVVSERHNSTEPRSTLRVKSGGFSTAQYGALFQYRWRSGVGLSLGGDFTSSEGERAASRNDQTLDFWAKFEWVRSQRHGVAFQIRRQGVDRDPRLGDGGQIIVPQRDGGRTDFIFKLFAGTRDDEMGLRAEAAVSSTAWTGDTLTGEQHVRQAFAKLRYSDPRFNAELRALAGDARVKSAIEGRVSFMPAAFIVLLAEGGLADHDFQRNSKFARGSLGIFHGPFSLMGQVTAADVLQAPVLPADTLQSVRDASLTFRLNTRLLRGQVGVVRRDLFLPISPPDLKQISRFLSSPTANYLIADVSFQPWQPLTFYGWYSHPRTIAADLQPPKHGRMQLTFRSKFWRTFPSGAFDLMVQYEVESWSSGTAGEDANGTIILHPGATFHEIFLQVQLVGFSLFWHLRNARNTAAEYIPGYPYPENAQTFGVKWEFTN